MLCVAILLCFHVLDFDHLRRLVDPTSGKHCVKMPGCEANNFHMSCHRRSVMVDDI